MKDKILAGLREEARPLVIWRVAFTLYLGAVTATLSMLGDLGLEPALRRDVLSLKVAGVAVYGLALVTLRWIRHTSWRTTAIVSVGAMSLAGVLTSAVGLRVGDGNIPALTLGSIVIGSAIFVPWGQTAQAAFTLVSALLAFPHMLTIRPGLAMTVLSLMIASVGVAVAMQRQARDRKAAELLRAGQGRVLELVAKDADLCDTLDTLLAASEEQVPGLICSVLLLDEERRHLRYGAARGLTLEYCHAIDDLAIGPEVGSCGTAAYTGERVVVTDVATDPKWALFRDLALGYDLRACWSEPILSATGEVIGTFATYFREPRGPTPAEIDAIAGATHLASIAIERRASRERLERYVEALDGARAQAEQNSVELAEARDQALASTRAKSEFLANMSHEIRTPLNGILGMTEILLESELSRDQRDHALTVRRCGEHLLTVINDILDFSKIEAGKLDIEHVEFDLPGLVEEVADLLATRAQEKSLEIACRIPHALPGHVRGDPARLRQVLVNLVGNAIKFTDEGEIVIEVTARPATEARLAVRVAVRDTGIGIPAHRHAAVFESFTQADGSTTRLHGGTGLGLTISRQLVHLMGGVIGLESAPGKGSTFWVDLDLERVPARADDAPPSLQGLHALVVDDNATNRAILRETLQSWGCRVDDAAGARAALARLQAAVADDPFGLVLLDMQMPEIDGVEAARLIRTDARFASVPLILLTSMGSLRRGTAAARALGFDAALTKPVRRSTLFNAIAEAVDGRRPDHEPVRHAPAEQTPVRAGQRVLLAEDNPVNQIVARRMLEKLGCRVDVVSNGQEAVLAATRETYDVVLMDVQMPTMDGLAATAEIRRRQAGGRRVPIIALTAHAMEGDRKRCLEAGMDDYLSKPINRDALVAALTRWGAGGAPARPWTTEASV